MATATNSSWKLDDGGAFAVNCFPARGITRTTHEGSGSWIVAYAHQQENKLRSIFKPLQKDKLLEQTLLQDGQQEFSNHLTEDFLINHHRVDSANDLCSVNISDCDLECADDANFSKFKNVAYINAAENLLSVHPFSTFPSLRELEMPVNGIRGIKIEPGDFPALQVLDLSYNNLSPTDVLALGLLPTLKVLTLTGNGLTQIHPDLCQPYMDKNEQTRTRFQSLEVLLLDDNRLNDMATFAALAALPSLKELNLDKNDITLVPYLKVIGDKAPSVNHSASQTRIVSAQRSNISRSSSRKSKSKEQKSVQSPESNISASPGHDTAVQTVLENDSSQSNEPLNQVESDETKVVQTEDAAINVQRSASDDKDTALNTELSFDASSSTPPFQYLKILSLAHNKIAEEEHLLAVAAWPELQAIILHGNPLVRNNKGEPPLLSHYLKKRLGISILRFKPKAPVAKPALRIPSQEKRKISTRVPKIPKQPIDAMLEALRKPALEPAPHSPTADEAGSSQTPIPPANDVDDDQENVFLTQLQEEDANIPVCPEDLEKESGLKHTKSKPVQQTIEEILQDAKPDPDIHENLSIQGNVKMLRQILHHPLSVSTVDPSPQKRLEKFSYQKKYLDTVEKMKQDVRVRPRPDAKSMRHRRIEETLSWMRQQPAASLELPLITALNETSNDAIQQEADMLLRDIEAKYRVVREESLKASRQTRNALKEAQAEVAGLQALRN